MCDTRCVEMDPTLDIDPDKDEVFISGLPLDITEEEVAKHFGQIGVIKEVCTSEKLEKKLKLIITN